MMDLALILITAALGVTVVIALYFYQVSFTYRSYCWVHLHMVIMGDSDLNSVPSYLLTYRRL